MIHCKNKDKKCHLNTFPYCSSKECPHYEYNGIWKEEIPPSIHLPEDILREFYDKIKCQVPLSYDIVKIINDNFWDLI